MVIQGEDRNERSRKPEEEESRDRSKYEITLKLSWFPNSRIQKLNTTKINSKWNIHLSVKFKVVKLLEGNIGET